MLPSFPLTTALVISCNSHTPPPTPGSLIKGEEIVRLLILWSVICGVLALLVRSGVTPQHSAGDTAFIITVIQLKPMLVRLEMCLAGEVGDQKLYERLALFSAPESSEASGGVCCL